MPKLYFRYGTMNSSKTSNLLMIAFNYKSQGKKVILVKPDIDTRNGQNIIHSRIIPEMKADIVLNINDENLKIPINTHCILVDEAQFLSEKNVEWLRRITEICPVICYGLRTDYRSRLFEGSRRLLELADSIEEIKTECVMCKKKAIINAKYHIIDGEKVIEYDGSSEPDLGMEDKYMQLCWNCWKC